MEIEWERDRKIPDHYWFTSARANVYILDGTRRLHTSQPDNFGNRTHGDIRVKDRAHAERIIKAIEGEE